MIDPIRRLLGNRRGYDVVRDPLLNKGSAFTSAERAGLGLAGILPPQSQDMARQARRVYGGICRQPTPLDKYVALMALQDRNEHLFYRVLTDHLEEFLPIVYTPTVGEATHGFSHVFQRARGLWVTAEMRGRVAQALANAVRGREIRLMVVTDNESILGIGDQGAGGIAISIGKLSLYVAAAGIHPATTLPVSLDVGTDNQSLLDDPLYLGMRHPRLRGAEYEALVGEFVDAVKRVCPGALVQWEDFRKDNALAIMNRYRDIVPSFNDDIQGTGAIALAALLGAGRITGRALTDERFVVLGAGAGGLGIARQIRVGLEQAGLTREQATARIAVLDSRGLLVRDNEIRDAYKRELAWSHEDAQRIGLGSTDSRSLADVVDAFHPTVLIGASGHAGSFTEPLVRRLASHVERPVIFPLSNPTDNAEARPADLIRWTDGRALVAAGSPFAPVDYDGKRYRIAQGNNAFVFPGLGLGILLCGAQRVTDAMITAAVSGVTACLTDIEAADGQLLPGVNRLRDVARLVAVAVIEQAQRDGVATRAVPDPIGFVTASMWQPEYVDLAEGLSAP